METGFEGIAYHGVASRPCVHSTTNTIPIRVSRLFADITTLCALVLAWWIDGPVWGTGYTYVHHLGLSGGYHDRKSTWLITVL